MTSAGVFTIVRATAGVVDLVIATHWHERERKDRQEGREPIRRGIARVRRLVRFSKDLALVWLIQRYGRPNE